MNSILELLANTSIPLVELHITIKVINIVVTIIGVSGSAKVFMNSAKLRITRAPR
jgi:hypothetical protein